MNQGISQICQIAQTCLVLFILYILSNDMITTTGYIICKNPSDVSLNTAICAIAFAVCVTKISEMWLKTLLILTSYMETPEVIIEKHKEAAEEAPNQEKKQSKRKRNRQGGVE